MNPLGASWYTREGLGLSFGVLLLLRVGWIIDRIDSPIIDIRVKRMFEKLGLSDGLPLGSSRKWIFGLLLLQVDVRAVDHLLIRRRNDLQGVGRPIGNLVLWAMIDDI